MAGLSALLSIDTSKLDAKIQLAGGAHGVAVSVSAANPLDMLGEAGTLIRTIKDLADKPADIHGAVAKGLGTLEDLAPFGDMPVLGEIARIFSEVKARLEPLKDLGGLDPSALVNRALQGQGGLDGVVSNIATQFIEGVIADVPAPIAASLGAVRDLAAGVPKSGGDVAGFFARFVLGLELAVVRAPFEVLDEVRGQVSACGGDLGPLLTGLPALTVRIDAVSEALLGAEPDMAAILAELTAVRGKFDDLMVKVAAGLERLAGDLAAIEPSALATRLDASLAPLLAHVPTPRISIGDMFLPPLRGIAAGLEGLNAAMLAEAFAEIEASIHGAFANSDVAVLRDQIGELLGGVTAFLKELPLQALRNQLTQALLGIEGKIGGLADFSPVHLLAEQVQKITDAIDKIDLSAVKAKLDELKAQIQGVVDGFPIGEIKDELGSLLEAANSAVADLPPLIDNLKSQIDALAGQITNISLDGAAAQSVGLLHDVRGHVKDALASGDLPEPLKAPIGLLADEVKKIDVTASIDAPLGELVAKVDVSALLAPVQKAVDDARKALEKLSPKSLIDSLDKPFGEVVAALETVSPAALVGQLSNAFKEAMDQLDRASPRTLVQPLQAEFDGVLAKARAAADPAPLLAPLKSAYGELQSLLDAIDPSNLLAKLLSAVTHLPGAMSGAVTGAMSQKLGAGTGLPGIPGDPAMKFGDIIRPFAQLIAEARAVVHRAAEGTIAEGLDLLSRPLALLAQGGSIAGGHVVEIAQALETRRGLVDATAAIGALPELREALARLARVEAGLSAAGRSSVELNASVVSIQLDTHITIAFPDRDTLDRASASLLDGLHTPAVARGMGALGNVLESFAPSALTLPNSEATVLAKLDALFDAIDLSPIADEMDALGATIQGKLQAFASDIAKALFRIWNKAFDEILPVLPQGLLPVLSSAFDAIRNQLKALDPALLEQELDALLDAVVASLEAYSPAAFADTLGGAFDALKAKLQALDPATLLGDLNPLQGIIDQVKALKPSIVLAPLAAEAAAVDAALARLLDLDLTAVITAAIDNLKAQIEGVVQQIEEEIDGLLGDLQAAGGGGSGSVSASVAV
jgi:hypothetical protein